MSQNKTGLLSPFTDAVAMINDIRGTTRAMNLWGATLNGTQFVGGLIFFDTPEGVAVLITVVLTLLVAGQIHKAKPFSRLTGICHLPWLGLLPWLVYRLMTQDPGVLLGGWLGLVCGLIAISLYFDTIDLYRYSRGQKTFAWSDRSK